MTSNLQDTVEVMKYETDSDDYDPEIVNIQELDHNTISAEELFEQCQRRPLDDLQSLLKSWNLNCLLYLFKAEKITIDVLKIMRPKHFEKLLGKYPIGTQITFEHHLEKWRNDIGLPYTDASCYASTQDQRIGHPRISTSTCIKSATIPSFGSESSHQHNRSTTAIQTDASALPLPIASSSRGTETAFEPSAAVDVEKFYEYPEKNISLIEILNATPKGKTLVLFYNVNGRFQEHQRNMLVNTIAYYYDERRIHMSMAKSYQIENEILLMFPSEKKEFYRTSKRGKIYNKCHNLKSSFKGMNPTSGKSKSNENPADKRRKFITEPNAEAHFEQLKELDFNSENFYYTWKSCVNYRLNEIENIESVPSFFEKWSFYKNPSCGYKLIEMDFREKYNMPKFSLLDEWKKYRPRIFDFLCKDCNTKEKNLRAMLLQLSAKPNVADNAYNATLLWTLHGYLLPTQKKYIKDASGRSACVKYAIRDSQDKFLVIVKDMLDIYGMEQCASIDQRGQPLIIGIGESVQDLQEICVLFQGTKFAFENFMQAVDCCCQIYFLFNLDYPIEARNFWSFLQVLFFKIENDKDAKFTKISVLVNEIEIDE